MLQADRMYDVAVVGSGPGGTSATIDLARRGLNVALIDKESLPRYKTCGGGIVHRVFTLLPDDVTQTLLNSNVIENRCYGVEFNLLASGTGFLVEREKPVISMVMRDGFDFELVKTAANSGANIIPECTVTDVETDDFGVRLSTTQGQIKAKFLLIADGATGTLARKLGWNESRHIIPALEYEVEVDENVYERYSRTARFDFDLVSDGYAWVFPKREHLSIGVLSMKRGRKDLKSLFQKYLNVLEIQHVNQITSTRR